MAEYRLFPNEKEIELEKECEAQKNKIDETIKDMRSRTDEQIKQNNKLSAAGKLSSAGFIVILIVVPFVTCVSVCSSVAASRSDIFPAVVEGILSMIIVGLIIMGIGWVVALKSDHVKGKRARQINEKFEYDVVDVKKKKSEIDNEYRDKISNYKRDFYAESDKRTFKFAGNPATDEIIHWMAEVINKEIAMENRGPQVSRVEKVLNFKVTEDKVATDFGNYVFIDHRISNLADAAETMALAKAIGTGLQAEIMTEFPTDPMGTPVRVNAAYTDDSHATLGRVTYNSEKADLV